MSEALDVTRRRHKIKKNYAKQRLIVFGILVLLMLLATVFAKRLAPYDYTAQDYSIALQAPSKEHIMGTDRFGRDMFSRVLVGAQTSIGSTLALVTIITVFGSAVGIASGYSSGVLDSIFMRISDLCLAFPGLVFALAIAAILQGGIEDAVIALAVISWPKYARISRSQTLSLKESDFICAARLAGSSNRQIIRRHILANIVGPILVTAALDIGTMMMELAGLSFLNLGAQPPTPEWGNMMSGGRSMLQTYPWLIISPGIAIFICVTLFNLLSDAARDFVDGRDSSRNRKIARNDLKVNAQ